MRLRGPSLCAVQTQPKRFELPRQAQNAVAGFLRSRGFEQDLAQLQAATQYFVSETAYNEPPGGPRTE